MNAPSPRFVTEDTERRGRKRSPYARACDVERLVKAAKKAGLDVTGIKALPDGSVEILAGGHRPRGLFDELEQAGKL